MDPNNPQHVNAFERRVFNLSMSIPSEEIEEDAIHLVELIKKHYPKGGFKFYEYDIIPKSKEHPQGLCSVRMSNPILEFDQYLENKYTNKLRHDAIQKKIYREVLGLTNSIWDREMEFEYNYNKSRLKKTK